MLTRYMRFVVVASASLVGVVATTTAFAQVAPSEFDSSANLFRERVAAYMQLRQAVLADLLETGLYPDVLRRRS